MEAIKTTLEIILPFAVLALSLVAAAAAADAQEKAEAEKKKNRSVRAILNNKLHLM